MKTKPFIFLLAVLVLGAVSASAAEKVRVVVKPAEPFVFEENGVLKGYSVDLWKQVAAAAGLDYETRIVATVPELREAVQSGAADVGVGAISITPDREKLMDFSHPFFKSGLQVMARSKGEAGAFSAFRALLNRNVAEVVIVLLLAVFLISHILWVVERKINPESFPEGYVRGVWESTWWSIATLISGGCENKAPVGTVTGSSAQVLLEKSGFNVAGFPDLARAAAALERGEVKGVVYDSPMLRYYLTENPSAPLSLVGPLFDLQDYGFALPLGSPLRKPVNAALLDLQVGGESAKLEAAWFEEPAE